MAVLMYIARAPHGACIAFLEALCYEVCIWICCVAALSMILGIRIASASPLSRVRWPHSSDLDQVQGPRAMYACLRTRAS